MVQETSMKELHSEERSRKYPKQNRTNNTEQ